MKKETLLESLIEVKLREPDDFLKVKETLTRIGIASKKEKTLYQSCHILHKQGKYYICHFKELFKLDGRPTDFTEEDKARRNTIIDLLDEWELVEVVNEDSILEPFVHLSKIKVLPYKEKKDWKLCSKYSVGIRK
jgi:hypothetical protein